MWSTPKSIPLITRSGILASSIYHIILVTFEHTPFVLTVCVAAVPVPGPPCILIAYE